MGITLGFLSSRALTSTGAVQEVSCMQLLGNDCIASRDCSKAVEITKCNQS